MKMLQTSLALVALFALMLPCAHADDHHDHDVAGLELCASDHADCHSCSTPKEPCSKPDQVAESHLVASLDLPGHPVQVLAILSTDLPASVTVPRAAEALFALQTVQLLI